MVLCSGKTVDFGPRHTSTITLVIAIVFCLVILASILFNYRDVRTKYALLLAALGSGMILFSITTSGGSLLYYTGVSIVFVGVWLNASLLNFLGNLISKT